MSVECSTPGLFKEAPSVIDNNLAVPSESDKSQENFIEINRLIQKINYYQKKENIDDQKDWIDKTSNEAIFQKLFDLYLNCQYSMIEISLPSWPFKVLYQDLLYEDVQMDYIFPKRLLKAFQQETGQKSQATDAKIFEKLYNQGKS